MPTSHEAEEPATMPHDSPLPRVHTLRSDKGSITLSELTVLCTNLSTKVTSLETELAQTKQTYGSALTKLIKKVKKLEQTVKSTQGKRRARLVISNDEEEKASGDTEILQQEEEATELVEDFGSGEKGNEVSTTTTVRKVYTRRSAERRKDKGKEIMQEEEPVQKKSKKQLEQERLSYEEAIRIQEQTNEEERQQIVRDAKIAKQLQEDRASQEQKKQRVVTEADPTKVIDWSDPFVIRYHALQNRPRSVAKDQIHEFVPMDSELVIPKLKGAESVKKSSTKEEKKKDDSSKTAKGKRKKTLARKRASGKDSEESAKRRKLEEDTEKQKLQVYLNIPPEEEGLDVESLAIKQDVLELYKLVKERFQTASPEGYDLLLWGDLKTMLEPDEEDDIWRNQQDWNLINWKLHNFCGVRVILMDTANCEGPHETFQCQQMNEDYYEQNSCYDPNSFGFNQYQPPQFPVNYPPQETSREILQAQEDLMEAIQAFLKEYDHIPPNEKCMALMLAEERFLKIKQTMKEEQNQPGVMQELLLKLMDDLQSLKGSQQEKKETAAQSLIPYWNSFMIDDEEARDNFLKDVCTFLRKFSHALMDKQYRPEDIQELMSKLLEDVRNINEEFLEYINCPSWNRPLFYFDDDDDEYTVIWRRPKAITLDEPSEEPEDPLIMREDELSIILEKDISSVENLIPIPSGSKGFSDDICDNDHFDAESLLSRDILITSPKIDFLSKEFAGEFTPIPPGMDKDEFDKEGVDCYDHDISSDDDSYENIEYVEASPLNLECDRLKEENEDQEEKEFDLEDIFQIQDVILRKKLLNVHRLITNIESLKNNPTPNFVLKSPSSIPISVTDSDSFFEESDTSLSYSDNSLPEFETFSDHTEETRSGSTTTHANNSLPEYDSFLF
ncbi:hypothetical protein Tco_0888064 [Tanacetum coccineum]